MSQRLPEILENYLRYHRFECSTEATIKFYAKELRFFLRYLEKLIPIARPLRTFPHLMLFSSSARRGSEAKGPEQSVLGGKPSPPG